MREKGGRIDREGKDANEKLGETKRAMEFEH